jgi:prepilin-type N-terminal cleavage/methylation domain-containing protein
VRGRGGFTLIEVVMAVAVLAVGVFSLLAALASSARVRQQAAETDLAVRGATSVIERIRATAWPSVFPTFDDASFTVPGLVPPAGLTECGRVTLFVNETAIPASLGGPRDLNEDDGGIPDDDDVSGTGGAGDPARFRVLPVRITISWIGVDGYRSTTFEYMLREGG